MTPVIKVRIIGGSPLEVPVRSASLVEDIFAGVSDPLRLRYEALSIGPGNRATLRLREMKTTRGESSSKRTKWITLASAIRQAMREEA